MKKREKKLQLHRETVLQLDSHLAQVRGGTGDMWTGCVSECTECGFGYQVDRIG